MYSVSNSAPSLVGPSAPLLALEVTGCFLLSSGFVRGHWVWEALQKLPLHLCLSVSVACSRVCQSQNSVLTLLLPSCPMSSLPPGYPGSESPCPRCRREVHRLQALQEAVLSIKEAQQELHRYTRFQPEGGERWLGSLACTKV